MDNDCCDCCRPRFGGRTQLFWQHRREARNTKAWVFNTMMGLRGFPLNPDFIKAANSIDVFFYANHRVREKWKAVLDYLSSEAYKEFTPQAFDHFRDLLSELLAEIARDLGYEYNHLHFKERAWAPSWHVTADEEWAVLRKKLIEAFDRKGSLTVRVESPAVDG